MPRADVISSWMQAKNPLAIILVLVLCLLTPVLVSVAATQQHESEEVVELPRLVVLSDLITITFSRSLGGELTGGEVTWVAKGSIPEKRGIEVYDELVSIDGVEVNGREYSEVRDSLERDLKPGQSIRLLFTGRRGMLGRHLRYVFVIKRA